MQKNNTFYHKIGKLVVPIVIQNLLSAAVSSADVVMLNYVGQSSISAVSLASQYASVLFMVFYGIGAGVTMLSAQYYGKGDIQAIQTIQGIALRFSLIISAGFSLLALLIPQIMMRLFTNDSELIAIGASYLRCMSICYLCWGVTEVYIATLRSTGKVFISTALNTLAFSVNVLLNAVSSVHRNWGLPVSPLPLLSPGSQSFWPALPYPPQADISVWIYGIYLYGIKRSSPTLSDCPCRPSAMM